MNGQIDKGLNAMRSLVLIATAGLCCSMLAGCAIPEKYQEKENIRQLDSATYEIELQQPWVEQEVMVSENARKKATNLCLERNQGMQPLQAITRSTREMGGKGAYVKFTFRCVGYMERPKMEYHRLGFYTDEESKKEAIERNREEYGY